MKEERFFELQNAVDPSLLEEAHRPVPRRGKYYAIGALAACACIAVLCLTVLPKQPVYRIAAGADNGTEESTIVTEAPMEACEEVAPEAAVADYDVAVQKTESATAEGAALPPTPRRAVPSDTLVPPADAEQVEQFTSDGPREMQNLIFHRNGIRYQCGAVAAVSPELSENLSANPMDNSAVYAIIEPGEVRGCPARLTFDEGGSGQIFWLDGYAFYSLSMDSGASSQVLIEAAETVFVPASAGE